MASSDSISYEPKAVVQKWTPEQMAEVQAVHGDREFDGAELEALGVQPAEVTTDAGRNENG